MVTVWDPRRANSYRPLAWPVRFSEGALVRPFTSCKLNLNHTSETQQYNTYFRTKRRLVWSQNQLWVVRVTGDPKLETWDLGASNSSNHLQGGPLDLLLTLLVTYSITLALKKNLWWQSAILKGPGDQYWPNFYLPRLPQDWQILCLRFHRWRIKYLPSIIFVAEWDFESEIELFIASLFICCQGHMYNVETFWQTSTSTRVQHILESSIINLS